MTGDPGLADIDRSMIKENSKTGNSDLLFLTVNIGNPLLLNVLVSYSSENIKRKIWYIKCHEKCFIHLKTPFALERSFKAAIKLRRELLTNIDDDVILSRKTL